MRNKSNDKKKAMIEALTVSLGIVTTACQKVNIARKTHYEWYNNDPEYKAAVDDVQNVAIDFAESKLFQNVKDGKETSIIYYLNNKGNSRGYSKTNFIDITSKGEKISILTQEKDV